MSELVLSNEMFAKLHLIEIIVPGSHDSGSQDMSVPNSIKDLQQTQFKTVFQQLCSGVRYIDLRIGSEPKIFGPNEIDTDSLNDMDLSKIKKYAERISLPITMVADDTKVEAYLKAIKK